MLAVIVLCLIRLGGQAYSFGYRVFAQETVSESPGRNVAVTISEGMSGKEIGELLEGRGLIRDAAVFRVQFALSDYKNAIVPGSYILNTAQTGGGDAGHTGRAAGDGKANKTNGEKVPDDFGKVKM